MTLHFLRRELGEIASCHVSVTTATQAVNEIAVHANGGTSDELNKMVESRAEVNNWQARSLGTE